jgi:hypothetical protein
MVSDVILAAMLAAGACLVAVALVERGAKAWLLGPIAGVLVALVMVTFLGKQAWGVAIAAGAVTALVLFGDWDEKWMDWVVEKADQTSWRGMAGVALVAGVGTGALGLGLAFAMHLDWIWGACVGALVAVIALATQWEDRRAAS